MPLHITYRPESLDEFYGNDALVESLGLVLARDPDKIPSTFLFTGRPGTGKTTLARIIQNALSIHDADFYAYNTANTRGIDTIRDVITDSHYAPAHGEKKAYFFDECFAKGTPITTVKKGLVPIEKIEVGESVFNRQGIDIVKNKFINKVPLDRVIRLNFSNGSSMFCSKEHEFDTDNGWKKAIFLDKHELVCYDSELMLNKNSQKDTKINDYLSRMPKRILSKIMERFILFGMQNTKSNAMPTLWENIFGNKIDWTSFLLSKMCWEMEKFPRGIQKESLFPINQRKAKNILKKILEFRFGRIKKSPLEKIYSNEDQKPNEKQKKHKENVRGKAVEWITSYLERKTWRERTFYRTTNTFSHCFGMADGSSCGIGEMEKRLSKKLQIGYSEHRTNVGSRSGRERSQNKKTNIIRQKERGSTERIRVESVEIYQRGSNDQSFQSVIKDKERNKGFIEFYDLEIEKDHSYIANNVMVHNCHKITVDGWNALLTSLEEPPAHVHFILATAEMEIIKPILREAIQRRSHQYEPKPLVRGELLSLLHDICGAEGLEPLRPVLEEITLMSNGSPGKALKMLDEVIDIEDPRVAIEALQMISTGGRQTEDLVKILIDPSTSGNHKWERARKALNNFSGDAEQTRRGILNYIEAIMLNEDTTMAQSMRLFKIQSLFFDSFMYIGRAGLTSATLLACKSGTKNDDISF